VEVSFIYEPTVTSDEKGVYLLQIAVRDLSYQQSDSVWIDALIG
jgi:hypothetical protein